MAASKSYFSRQNYRFLSTNQNPSSISPESAFELDESDIYTSNRSNSPEIRKPITASSRIRKPTDRVGANPSSLPVNIPDWSKILKEEYRESRRWDSDDDDGGWDGGETGVKIPPHEFLARTRIASFSVHEGVGRTLKGRDLSRVRNAIWEKIGFQD